MMPLRSTLPDPQLCTSALALAAHDQSRYSRRLGTFIRVKNSLLCDVAWIAHQMLNGGKMGFGRPAWPIHGRRQLLSATTLPSARERSGRQRTRGRQVSCHVLGEEDVAGMKSGENLGNVGGMCHVYVRPLEVSPRQSQPPNGPRDATKGGSPRNLLNLPFLPTFITVQLNVLGV
jgi:hypothetical protein